MRVATPAVVDSPSVPRNASGSMLEERRRVVRGVAPHQRGQHLDVGNGRRADDRGVVGEDDDVRQLPRRNRAELRLAADA